MKIVMGSFQILTPQATSVTISKAANDPVPSCKFSIYDQGSTLQALAYQEVLVIDSSVIANPTINLLYNPTLNPYNQAGNWFIDSVPSGVTLSQNGGGGLIVTFNNTAVGSSSIHQLQPVIPGQTYTLSATIAGSSPVHITTFAQITWLDAAQQQISFIAGSTIIPGASTVYSVSATAPDNTYYCQVTFYYTATNSTNSGSITYTKAQLEPQWFASTQSYPTPFCGPSQTNCRQLPLGQWIRQYRKFAGFVTSADYGDYIGNNRTIQVAASGYAWLLSTIYTSKSYTSQFDSAIFIDLLNTYLVATVYTGAAFSTLAMCSTTNVIQGVQLSNFPINWDDLRTVANNLASQIGWCWGIGDYWDAYYTPPGYVSAAIGLICDRSGTPDNVTTFPAYNFKAKMDATQPGSNILVLGNGSNTAQVVDPAQINIIGTRSGYILPTTTSWMRKVNESSLNSTTDCTQRGVAELLQYDHERYIYTLTTDNVELIAGQAIQVTSATEGLSATTLIIQQVSASWTGKSELLSDVWEYNATLGAINRQVASIMSRLFRSTNSNTSAPAIASTSLVLFERVGVQDTYASRTTDTSYRATIVGDGPLAYYRLDELIGTIADDYSGNTNQGTLHGTVTLGAAGLLSETGKINVNTAMSFDGVSGYITLPTAMIPTGSGHAWSLECWCKFASIPAAFYHTMAAMGKPANQQAAFITLRVVSGNGFFVCGTYNGDVQSGAAISTGTIYHVVGTYDGVNVRLYVNSSLVAGPTAFTDNLIPNFASIGGDWGGQDLCPAIIDEVAFYDYALSSTYISNHYTAGTSTTSDYASTILGSTPRGYYRMADTLGTTATDSSGNGYNGTIGSGVTLGTPGLLATAGDKAMSFDGSTGYISLPTTLIPTGAHAWSLECWVKTPASMPANGYYSMLGMGDSSANLKKGVLSLHVTATPTANWTIPFTGFELAGPSGVATSTIYHVVGTYDGTNARLYVNGSLVAGPTAFSLNLAATFASIAANDNTPAFFYPGTIDEPAFYNYALSSTQVSNHYTAGTT